MWTLAHSHRRRALIHLTTTTSSTSTRCSLLQTFVTIRNASTKSTHAVELYQYEICPFCNKAKAFLNYAKIPYQAIEVNPLTKKEIQWSKDYRKVPLARLVDDKNVVVYKGSDEMVQGLVELNWVTELLQQQWNNKNNHQNNQMTLHEFAQSDSAQKWVEYTNRELAVLLYPNLCPTLQDSYRAFEYVNHVSTFSPWQRMSIRTVGSLAMYMAASRVKKKHAISDPRGALDEALQKPIQSLHNARFLSGHAEEPHVGDLAVYGALRGLQGTRVHTEILQSSPAHFQDWYDRVETKVDKKKA